MPSVGVRFSDHFGVDEDWMIKNNVFNPTLDIDAPLFIDPFLLIQSTHKEFSDCAFNAYDAHFQQVFGLLRMSEELGDKAWSAALGKFQFGEARGMGGTCLGYSARSDNGRGFGKKLSAQSLEWAREVIRLGVKDPEFFSSLPLFEGGVGPDLISDMVAHITLECIIAFNTRVIKQIEAETSVIVPVDVTPISHPAITRVLG